MTAGTLLFRGKGRRAMTAATGALRKKSLSSSETQPRRDFNFTRAPAPRRLNIGDCSKCRCPIVQIRCCVVRVIERVGRRSAQLESNALADAERLQQREGNRLRSRADNRADRRVPCPPDVVLRNGEGSLVDPEADALVIRI